MARHVAQALAKQHPGLGADEIAARMRADLGPHPDPGALALVEAVRARLPARPAAVAPAETGKVTWRSPSSLALIAANLLALWGVLAWDWPVFPILLLFWMENVIVGALNVARMLLLDPGDLATWAGKLLMVPFFCVHYGMFTLVHGVFVLALFGGAAYERAGGGLFSIEPVLRAVRDYDLWLPVAALAGSHLFSFVWNYCLRGEYQRASLQDLMARPYGRVMVLHVTILAGGFAAQALGSPLWALLLLIALKIGIDLAAHIKERGKMAED